VWCQTPILAVKHVSRTPNVNRLEETFAIGIGSQNKKNSDAVT
jgi:hypothetical protein